MEEGKMDQHPVPTPDERRDRSDRRQTQDPDYRGVDRRKGDVQGE